MNIEKNKILIQRYFEEVWNQEKLNEIFPNQDSSLSAKTFIAAIIVRTTSNSNTLYLKLFKNILGQCIGCLRHKR